MKYYRLRKYLPRVLEQSVRVLQHPRYHLALYRELQLARRGVYQYPHPILLIAGLPKSGTTWIENFLFRVPGYIPKMLSGDVQTLIQQDLPRNAFAHFPTDAYSFVKTHTNPREENFRVIEAAGIKRVIVSIRDPRDVCLSRYFYLLKHPKSKHEPGFIDYRTMAEADAIRDSAETIIRDYLPWIRGWLARIAKRPAEHLLMQYETVLSEPAEQFFRLCEFCELGLTREAVEEMLGAVQIQSKRDSKTASGTAGIKSTLSRGESGYWEEYFDTALRTRFEEEAADIFDVLYGNASASQALVTSK